MPAVCQDKDRSIDRKMVGLKYIKNIDIYRHTSSTAQGGGGSFKNRKPIGEIGCCESGMAEPKGA